MPIQALCILMGLPKYFLEYMYKDAPNFNNFQLFRTDDLKIQLLRFKCMKTALFCRLFTQDFTPDICRIKVSRSWTWRFETSLYVFVAPTIAENQKENLFIWKKFHELCWKQTVNDFRTEIPSQDIWNIRWGSDIKRYSTPGKRTYIHFEASLVEVTMVTDQPDQKSI